MTPTLQVSTDPSFTLVLGEGLPETQVRQVQAFYEDTGGPYTGPLNPTLARSAEWFQFVAPSNLKAPLDYVFSLQAQAVDLPPGRYVATAKLTSTDPTKVTFDPLIISVTLTVLSAAPPPVDGIAPVVTIHPLEWINKKVAITASANDDSGDVLYMEILIDGELQWSAPGKVVSMLWNTLSLRAKNHVIEARAYDRANNRGVALQKVTLP